MIPKWIENASKNRPGAIPKSTDSSDKPKAPQKVTERAHRHPGRAKGTQQDDTSTPKKRQKLQKGAKRSPKASDKAPQIMKKTSKRQVFGNCFLVFKNNVLPAWELNSGRRMTSHASKTPLLKTEKLIVF